MKVNYNIQKEERKAMVGIVSKVLETKPVYCGAPSFSYKIGAFEITKEGSLCFDDATDEATVARVRTALHEAGFMSEDGENKASCADTGEDKPIQTEVAEDELASVETAEIEPSQTEAVEDNVPVQMETPAEVIAMEEAVVATDEDSLSISLPRTLFTETALQNLTGSSAFKSGHRKGAENHAVSE